MILENKGNCPSYFMVTNFHFSTKKKPKAFSHSIIMLYQISNNRVKNQHYINLNYTNSNHSLAQKKIIIIIHSHVYTPDRINKKEAFLSCFQRV